MILNEAAVRQRRWRLPNFRLKAPLPPTLATYDRMGEEDELAVMGTLDHGNVWVHWRQTDDL